MTNKECVICNKSYPNTDIIDFDSGKSAHMGCFFEKQEYLECGNNYTSYIRNNPINGKWYLYNNDNEYKHSEYSITYCPFCGQVLEGHKQ
jgi:hypothetical protein